MVTITVADRNGFINRSIGLIGALRITPIYFETRFGIHTFGVKFPIDVLVLDKTSRIVSLKKMLKPNRIYIWNPTYRRVIELPEGTINSLGINKNDYIKVVVSPKN